MDEGIVYRATNKLLRTERCLRRSSTVGEVTAFFLSAIVHLHTGQQVLVPEGAVGARHVEGVPRQGGGVRGSTLGVDSLAHNEVLAVVRVRSVARGALGEVVTQGALGWMKDNLTSTHDVYIMVMKYHREHLAG